MVVKFSIPQATVESETSTALNCEVTLFECLKKSWLLNNRKSLARVVECTIRALSEDKTGTLSNIVKVYLPQIVPTAGYCISCGCVILLDSPPELCLQQNTSHFYLNS